MSLSTAAPTGEIPPALVLWRGGCASATLGLAAVDYWGGLRTIDRLELVRQETRKQRRFLHYLERLQLDAHEIEQLRAHLSC